MKIELNESEVKQAIKSFINSEGIDLSEKDISILFVAGRGENNSRAAVEINPKTNVSTIKSKVKETSFEEETSEITKESPIFDNVS